MRRVGALLFVCLAGCIDHPDPPTLPSGELSFPADTSDQSQGPSTQNGSPSQAKDARTVLTEVVYVLMEDWNGDRWMCTGALVDENRVLTAGHCLDDNNFASFEVVAPLASGKPRVAGSYSVLYSYDHEDITAPDIGILHLEEPIEVPNYAKLTDVTDRVEKGEKLNALAIVREEEEFEAPFKVMKDLAVSSSTDIGYDRGFSVPYFSNGGDSGTGLFLVEGGQITHKLIAVARNPEPETDLDHFTRIDDEILGWIEEN